MKNLILILSIFILSIKPSHCQDNQDDSKIESLFQGNKIENITGYGGPIFKMSYMNGIWSPFFGGQGAVLLNRTVAFGLRGIGSSYGINKFQIGNEDRYLKLMYGGAYAEYINNLSSTFHISTNIGIMGGKYEVSKKTSENSVKDKDYFSLEESYIFILEPQIALEVNLTSFFIAGITLDYRFAMGPSMKDVKIGDINGFSAGITLKFGKF